jgi:cytochrome c554/c'-like protein
VFVCFLFLFFLLMPGSQEPAPPAQPPPSTGSSTNEKKPPPRRDFVGDDACRSCHQQQAKTYLETGHHWASSWPSPRTVKGSFTPDSNIMRTSNPYLHFEMTVSPAGYFQSAVEEPGEGKKITRTERIDIVAGLPRKGQSYLFWKGDQLFQLPVTYWVETNSWVNSPSYPDGSPHFDKAIIPRCLECHASSFEWMPPPVNRYRKSSLVLGISCEKCHGPGRAHVALHTTAPGAARGAKSQLPPGTSEQIVNPAKLPRDRQIDVCGLCHSGNGTPIAPSLSFLPGDVLDDYIDIPYSSPEDAVDVHGNQVQLLKKSRCFQSTTTLTCNTCHDVHTTQNNAAAFSAHCLSCHEPKQCGEHARLGDQIANNCIDCHMPLQESKVLFSNTNGKHLEPKVRNHRIGIYADAKPQ